MFDDGIARNCVVIALCFFPGRLNNEARERGSRFLCIRQPSNEKDRLRDL